MMILGYLIKRCKTKEEEKLSKKIKLNSYFLSLSKSTIWVQIDYHIATKDPIVKKRLRTQAVTRKRHNASAIHHRYRCRRLLHLAPERIMVISARAASVSLHRLLALHETHGKVVI